MPNDAARCDAMLFDYRTTTKTDYKTIKFEPVVKSLYREKKRVRAAYKNVKDIRTLIEWNGPRFTFDLLWGSPKPIVRTDPRQMQQPVDRKRDLGREQAQRTRPRLVMTPAISMDDIEDANQRKMLTEDIYRSSTEIALKEGVALTKNINVRAPFPGRYALANPVGSQELARMDRMSEVNESIQVPLGRLKPLQVPLEWRRETVSWDYEQLRSHVEPEREFWLRGKSLDKY